MSKLFQISLLIWIVALFGVNMQNGHSSTDDILVKKLSADFNVHALSQIHTSTASIQSVPFHDRVGKKLDLVEFSEEEEEVEERSAHTKKRVAAMICLFQLQADFLIHDKFKLWYPIIAFNTRIPADRLYLLLEDFRI